MTPRQRSGALRRAVMGAAAGSLMGCPSLDTRASDAPPAPDAAATWARPLPPACVESAPRANGVRVVEAADDCRVPGLPLGTNLALVAALTSRDEPVGLPGLGAALAEVSLEADPDGARDDETTLASVALGRGAEIQAVSSHGRVGWALRLSDPTEARALLSALVGVASDVRASNNLVATWAERRAPLSPDDATATAWAASLAAGHGWPVGAEVNRPLLSRLHREDLVRLHRRLFVGSRVTVVVPRGVGDAVLSALDAMAPGEMPPPGPPCEPPPGATWAIESRLAGPALYAAPLPEAARAMATSPPAAAVALGLAALAEALAVRGGHARIERIDATYVLVADGLALDALDDLIAASPPLLPALLGPEAASLLASWVTDTRRGVVVHRGPEAPEGATPLPRSHRPVCTARDARAPGRPGSAGITLQDAPTGVISVPNFKAKPGQAPARARTDDDAHATTRRTE